MYGAILGDMIGAPYEFDRDRKTKEFEMFHEGVGYTDDSVMTVAVADALLGLPKDADDDTVKAAVIRAMQEWGHKYPVTHNHPERMNTGYSCQNDKKFYIMYGC